MKFISSSLQSRRQYWLNSFLVLSVLKCYSNKISFYKCGQWQPTTKVCVATWSQNSCNLDQKKLSELQFSLHFPRRAEIVSANRCEWVQKRFFPTISTRYFYRWRRMRDALWKFSEMIQFSFAASWIEQQNFKFCLSDFQQVAINWTKSAQIHSRRIILTWRDYIIFWVI